MLNDLLAKNQSSDKLYVEDVFSTWLYTGNGSTQTITNGIDLAGKGGLVWLKERSPNGYKHDLFDTARGYTKQLSTNETDPEYTQTFLSGFNSNGFGLNTGRVNSSGSTYASWTFRKAPKFFDVVTWTGNQVGQTINHSLGAMPGMIIVKRTNSTSDWGVWHRSAGGGLALNITNAAGAVGYPVVTGTITSTSFDPNTAYNQTGGTYVAYLFAHDTTADGVIQCGSFTADANGAATVTLGFEPQFLIAKTSSTTGSWFVVDNMRGWSLSSDSYVYANTSAAEVTNSPNYWNPTATGFTCKNGCFPANSTVIYLAIRRGPMRVPTDATKVYTSNATTNTTNAIITTNFAVDLSIDRVKASGYNWQWQDRLRGSPLIQSNTTSAEFTPSPVLFTFDNNTGVKTNGFLDGEGNAQVWTFRRAPGFFDVVCYTGTGATLSVSHNLGATPELLILKRRNSTGGWPVWRTATGAGTTFGYLNDNGAEADQGVSILTAPPTSSAFSVGAWGPINASGGTYVAYLFASCPGVSKVGSYTGTGTTLQINCGFTNGARFVLIKRTDSTGDWYVYDSARGIVAGNDPYLLLNSTAAEVTNTDYVDAYSAGFELSSTAPAALNANGGTYIYLAIA